MYDNIHVLGFPPTLVVSECFKVARWAWNPPQQMVRGKFSECMLYSWLIMGAFASFWFTVRPDFNRPFSESASLSSTAPQAADAPRWCSLDNLELICFHIWFIHCSLGWQGKAVLAGCVAVSDGSDLGVRLWVRRLFNGPIRSGYHSLPHHDRDALSLMNHLLFKNNSRTFSCGLSCVILRVALKKWEEGLRCSGLNWRLCLNAG